MSWYFCGVNWIANCHLRFSSIMAFACALTGMPPAVALGLGPDMPAMVEGDGAVMPPAAGEGAAMLPGVGAVVGSAML